MSIEEELSELRARLARLEAKEAIQATFNQYLYSLDTGNAAGIIDAYAVDAVLDVINFPPKNDDLHFEGRDSISTLYTRYGKAPTDRAIAGGHNSTNVSIAVSANALSATFTSYFSTTHNFGAQGGRYEGTLAPDADGRWRFQTLSIISAWGFRAETEKVSDPVNVRQSRFGGAPATGWPEAAT